MRILALSLIALVTASSCFAAGLNSGAAFLKIGTGARPTAMGGAYTALADDVNALYYNPSGLANLTKRELGATHAQCLLDTTFDFIGYVQPTKRGAFGLGVARLGAGSQEGRDANGQATGSFEASDTAYTVGFSRKLQAGGLLAAGRTNLGVNLKYLQSRIGSDSASTFAFDLGAQHQLRSRPLSLGLSVLNIGKGMRFLDQTDPLPLTFAIGTAYRFGGLFQVALDVRHEIHDRWTGVGVGTEYAILPAFSLRAGYTSQVAQAGASSATGALSGLGGGFGLKMGSCKAAYTFTPFGALGNAQKISLGARF